MRKKAEVSWEMVRWPIALGLLLLLLLVVPTVVDLAKDLLDKIRFPTGELPAVTYDEERIPVGTILLVSPTDLFITKQEKGWKLTVLFPTTGGEGMGDLTVLENVDLVTVLNSDKLIGGIGYASIKIVGRTYVHAPDPEDTDPSTPDLMWFVDKKENYKYDGTDEKVTTEKVAEQILAMLYEEAT